MPAQGDAGVEASWTSFGVPKKAAADPAVVMGCCLGL